MINFKQQYDEKLEDELKQFLFLSCEKDRKLLLVRAKKNQIKEYVRMACICIIFGYRTVLLKIIALSEKHFDEFMNGLKSAGKNLTQIDKWLNDFIENIRMPEARELARAFWQERKATVDGNDFNINKLFN